MDTIQWTSGTTIIAVVFMLAGALVGFFAESWRRAHQLSRLSTQLEQALHERDLVASQQGVVAAQLKEAETQCHQLQVAEVSLRTQLDAATQTAARLSDEAKEHKAEHGKLQTRLDEVVQQQHDAEMRCESAQAEGRGREAQIADLRTQLDSALEARDGLRKERDHMKDTIARESERARAAEVADREAREQLSETKQALQKSAQATSALQERYQALSSEHTELKTMLTQREEHFAAQMAQLADSKKALTQEFENLANKIFEEKGKTFTHTSQASIDGLLKPFREQIEGFQKRINEVHDASLQGNTVLNAEIKKVLDIGLQMSQEASNLTSALKGDSQQRGAWGEAQLRRTLEMSGLVEEAHYEVQTAFKDAEGKHKQTDYLIKLPDGKHLIIDSKVSLVAYDRAVGAVSPEEYQLAMAEHIKAVRKHIDDLASKDYTNLVGMRSPSFVLMFMPIEPAYIEALKSNKDLFEYGYKKGVVLVSHTTLIPILRTVSNLWMIERSNAEAREISEKAGDIYNQVCTVAERLSKLGGTLNTASHHFNDTVKALAGTRGLYGKVDRFSKLSAKVSKTLPQLEPAHMDFEAERLELIVEAIEEPAQPAEPVENLGHESL